MIFEKKVFDLKMCDLTISTNFVLSFSHLKRTERDKILNVYWSPRRVHVIVVIF